MRELAPMRFYIGMKKILHSFSAFLLLFVTLAATTAAAKDQYLFYVGTYTENTKSKGIYAFRYDASTGEVTPLGLAAETTNPSFLAISPNGRFLYAVNEVPNYKGPNSGGVSAFAIDQKSGKLTFLNEVPSRGADPCYIIVDKTGKYVLVANYTGGSVAVFSVLADGKLGEGAAFVQHTGHGADPKRQEGPHAHSIDLSRSNDFAYVDDLGLDELLVYKFDQAKGTLTPNDPPFARVDAGAGPRHIAFPETENFAFVITEMQGTVNVFSNAPGKGELHFVQKVSTLPQDYAGEKEDAEIHVHPSGKFVYASNRGEGNSIAVFAINSDGAPGGRPLKLVEITPTQGKTPRSFEIDPTGALLFAENQNSDNIVLFRIDDKTGHLTPTGKVIDVASPVCVKFVKVE